MRHGNIHSEDDVRVDGSLTDGTNASSPANIKDAVTKKHTQNTDSYSEADLTLDFATAALMRTLIQESFDRKAHDLSGDENMGNCWVDTFNDATGIGAGSEKYTHRTSPNYDVIVQAGLELDYMEYANDGAAQAAYVTSDSGEPSWDLLDEDCSDISDWTDDDGGNAVSEVDPAGQFRFDTNAKVSYARRWRDIGDTPDTFTFEIKLYHDAIGTEADKFMLQVYQADEGLEVRFRTDGLMVFDTDEGTQEVGTNLVKEGEWQTWRFLVTFGTVGDGTCDIYLNDSTHNWEKVGTAIPCSYEYSPGNGHVLLRQYGESLDDRITHVDYVKMSSGLTTPTANLQSYSESTIKNQGSYSLKAIAVITDSLNDTLTKSGLSLDLTDKDELKIDVRASRTGTNLQVQLKESESIDQQNTSFDDMEAQGGVATDKEYRQAQSFQLSADLTVTAAELRVTQVDGSPTGNWTVRIETDNSGVPSGTLADGNATVSGTPPTAGNSVKYSFGTPFVLNGSTTYWLVIQCDNQVDGDRWRISTNSTSVYADGMNAYSVDGGTNWSERATIDNWFKIYTETVHTKDIAISSADTWETTTWDISGISNAQKDAIDSIVFKILNADSATTYYIDNFIVPAGDATLISIAQTASSAPDNILVMWEENLNGGTVTFYASRDGGSTWATVTSPSNYTSPVGTTKYKNIDMTASGIGSGTSLKLKAIVTGAAELESWAMAWA